jgi:hypothetical protein
MTTPSTPTKQKDEPPYFIDAPSITSPESRKDYYRKLLEPFTEIETGTWTSSNRKEKETETEKI